MIVKVYGMDSSRFALDSMVRILLRISEEKSFPEAIKERITVFAVSSKGKGLAQHDGCHPYVEVCSEPGVGHYAKIIEEELSRLGFIVSHVQASIRQATS